MGRINPTRNPSLTNISVVQAHGSEKSDRLTPGYQKSTRIVIHNLEPKKSAKLEALKRITLRAKTEIYQQACYEVEEEMKERNGILAMMGLMDFSYWKDKPFFVRDYTQAPNLKACGSKDFLDFYLFPYLLPAIQALIVFMREKRLLQCKVSTFSPLDFLSEYLYNTNPRYPNRAIRPVPLFETYFAEQWLRMYPRPPPPKWLTMSRADAALAIQRVFRGFLVRKRPDVQEMRVFWIEWKKSQEDEKLARVKSSKSRASEPGLGEKDSSLSQAKSSRRSDLLPRTHSDECLLCAQFKDLLEHKSANGGVRSKKKKNNSGQQEAKNVCRCLQTKGILPFTTPGKRRLEKAFTCLESGKSSKDGRSLVYVVKSDQCNRVSANSLATASIPSITQVNSLTVDYQVPMFSKLLRSSKLSASAHTFIA